MIGFNQSRRHDTDTEKSREQRVWPAKFEVDGVRIDNVETHDVFETASMRRAPIRREYRLIGRLHIFRGQTRAVVKHAARFTQPETISLIAQLLPRRKRWHRFEAFIEVGQLPVNQTIHARASGVGRESWVERNGIG